LICRGGLLHLDLTARAEVADVIALRARGYHRYAVADRLSILVFVFFYINKLIRLMNFSCFCCCLKFVI
jgi:hypothetical protein